MIDVGRQRVTRGAQPIVLPKLSFDLLLALARRAPDVLSNEALLAQVWPGLVVNPETVVQRVKLLRDALEDRAGEPRYIAALRGRGYQLVARACRVDDATVAVRDTDSVAQPTGPQSAQIEASLTTPGVPQPPAGAQAAPRLAGRWRNRRAVMAILATAMLAGVFGIWLVHRELPVTQAPTADDAALHTVAVLPFRNLSANPGDAFIALGVPDIVLDRLTSVQGLTVVARGSAFRAGAESSDPRSLGQRLNAAFIVDGTVQRNGDALRITARLVDARARRQVWSERFDRSVGELFAIQDEISEHVAAALSEHVAGLRPISSAVTPTPDVEAYLSYLRGRVLIGRYTAAQAEAAANEFARAIERDPAFAAAYAALYDARMQAAALRFDDVEAARRQNRPLLEKALALDPHSGTALFARAMWDHLDDVTREATFREALRRDPGNSRGMTSFAEFLDVLEMRASAGRLRGIGLFPQHFGYPMPRGSPRDSEATRLLQQAISIDPLSASARFQQIDRANLGRKATETQMQGLLAIDPEYYPALQRVAKQRWLFHDSPSQAIGLIEKAIETDPSNPFARQAAVAFYLDIDDADAAADVASGTPVSAVTAAPALALHAGDWRSAGQAARRDESFVFDVFEDYGSAQALRDEALRTRDFATAKRLLSTRYAMSLDGPVQIALFNFRTWVLLAHLQLMSGNAARGRQILESVIAWIDSDHEFGPVYNRRTRAQALMLLGRREEALRDLAASFYVDRDHVEWWYTIDHDPVWADARTSPEFQALAAEARRFAARERAAVETLRSRREVPRRPGPPPAPDSVRQ